MQKTRGDCKSVLQSPLVNYLIGGDMESVDELRAEVTLDTDFTPMQECPVHTVTLTDLGWCYACEGYWDTNESD